MKKTEIKRREKQIREERAAYYAGEPNIPDSAFDRLMNELRVAAPTSRVLREVGAKPAGSTGEHSIPMGSLDEAKTMEEMQAWMRGITGGFLVMEKVDGLSLSLDYEKGYLTQALTRGNGRVGEDVTANVRRMMNVPSYIPGFDGTLRGEAVMGLLTFKEKYAEDAANPRNTAAGIVRRHSGEGAEDIVLRYFYVKIANGQTFPTRSSMLAFIRDELGCNPVQSFTVSDIAQLQKRWNMVTDRRDRQPYEIDGIVVYTEDMDERDPGDPFLPADAMVWKFEPETAETTVTRIEHRAGRSGRVNPRVHVEPVQCGGVTVTHATGNNYPWLWNLGVGVGAKVEVSRRGDTIPAIEHVIKEGKTLETPTRCPECDTLLAKDGAYLKCGNIGCSAKSSGSIAHWFNLIELKGVGPKMLAKLADQGIKRPHELYEKGPSFWLAHFGKNGNKILEQLLLKKDVPLKIILASLIPNVGRRRFQAIIDDTSWSTVKEFRDASEGELMFVDGIGPEIARTVVDGMVREGDNLSALANCVGVQEPVQKTAGGSLDGWALQFTGKMQRKRKELEAIAEENGARIGWKSGFRNVLVIADVNSTSTKAKAARKAGHDLITEEDFMNRAGQ